MSTTSPAGTASDDRDKAVQVLRGLGLTRTEAEVYFTALQTCSTEPVSSYKLAQVMGRDPANVAKTLTALVRLQAMTVVQDKPRLFLPTDPTTFTDQVLARVQSHSQEAVELLRHFQAPEPDGVTLGLSGAAQIFAKARQLLAGCQSQAQLFGSKECLRELGGELEELAERNGCTVQLLSPLDMVSEHVEIAVFSPVSDLAELLTHEFLLLVVDSRAWLSAVVTEETGPTPGGWWGDHSPIAAVMGGAFSLAWAAGRSAQATPLAEPEAEPEVEPEVEPEIQPDIAPPVAAVPEPETELPPEPVLPPAVEQVTEKAAPPIAEPAEGLQKLDTVEEDPEEFEEGITFLMRHEDRKKE